MKRPTRIALLAASFTLAGVLLAPPALGGPPLLCFPYEIGEAKSLPWGGSAFSQSTSYDRAKVVRDTLSLLKTERSTLVRMETIRRASLYLKEDPARATELLAKLGWIAMDAEAAGKPSSEAWFNAGFLAATLRQAGAEIDWKPGVASGREGFAWIQRGLALDADNAAMHFGAALVIEDTRTGLGREHLARAVASATPGSDLAKSIESNHALGNRTLKQLRTDLGITDATISATGGR